MYNPALHQQINEILQQEKTDIGGKDNLFYTRFIANATAIDALFREIYGGHASARDYYAKLIRLITKAYTDRPETLKQRDAETDAKGN